MLIKFALNTQADKHATDPLVSLKPIWAARILLQRGFLKEQRGWLLWVQTDSWFFHIYRPVSDITEKKKSLNHKEKKKQPPIYGFVPRHVMFGRICRRRKKMTLNAPEKHNSKGRVSGSRQSMHGYISTYSRLKKIGSLTDLGVLSRENSISASMVPPRSVSREITEANCCE